MAGCLAQVYRNTPSTGSLYVRGFGVVSALQCGQRVPEGHTPQKGDQQTSLSMLWASGVSFMNQMVRLTFILQYFSS